MENWKPIAGFEGLFEVSDQGRVRSVDKYDRRGHLHKSRILRQQKSKTGYQLVTLTVNGKGNTKSVHRLVADAFLPNQDNKPEVNHLDGDKSNNCVSNLEWVTKSENGLHSFRELGRKPSRNWLGKPGTNRKFTDEQAEAIRNDPRTVTEIAHDYGVCLKTITLIRRGVSYRAKASEL